VQASQGTTYPLMQYVLTAFGDGNIGFAPTLEEALNQTFGGDSGAQAGDAGLQNVKEDISAGDGKAPAAGTPGATPGATPAPGTTTPTQPAPQQPSAAPGAPAP
ncbi:UPF0182 family protein, partial [Pauljensenia sp. UMB3104]|nr:UPF0182 family protein [Pauljensenia sp. UMB3104]